MVVGAAMKRLLTLKILIIFGLAALLGGIVNAHATLVFATLTAEPAIPQAEEPFTLIIMMTDPTNVPIEDALVFAEFSHPDAADPVIVEMSETSNPGVYEGDVTLNLNGTYDVLLRDKTFRQEEAKANLEVILSGEAPIFVEGDNTVVFPPTATTDPNSVRTWLIWVIALPVLAGVIVTVLVLRNSSPEDEDFA